MTTAEHDHPPVRASVIDEGILEVSLSRPSRLNAYTPSMCRMLCSQLDAYEEDDDLRAMILTGDGRGFCAGGDVRGDDPEFQALLNRQMGRAMELRRDMHGVCRTLHRIDKPVIAKVNGVAVSGGLALALFCDVRIAARSARLGDPSGRVGLLPDDGGAWAFPRAMGYDRAFLMVALNELYSADEAYRLGLVTEVVDDDVLGERTLELARQLASRSSMAVRGAKRLMRGGLERPLDQSLTDAELAVMVVNTGTEARHGLQAFNDGQEPDFSTATPVPPAS